MPSIRVRRANDSPRRDGEYVLYWMIAARRLGWSFGLQRAAELARELGRPLVVFEPLRLGYRWASDRFHRFVLDGMVDNARAAAGRGVRYHPWIERQAEEGSGLLEALAGRASVVVADDFPCFFLPRMLAAAARRLPVALEAVDSNGLLPLAASGRVFARAVDFRRHLQKTLPNHLGEIPLADPLADLPPATADLLAWLPARWGAIDPAVEREQGALSRLPIDHQVPPVATRGGSEAAGARLARFLLFRLGRYLDGRLDVDDRSTSELSAHLHFGHLSAHEIFVRVAEQEGWSLDRLAERASGAREGWWGMSPSAEAFLDQLITWRELGYSTAAHGDDADRWQGLPAWARRTLEDHADDPRPELYSLEELENGETADAVWNAAQAELRTEGTIHNYLRMLWGKKILEWSPSPQVALERMLALNDRWAIDGRDPNSYSGISWVLGRYDRPWGPTRPIYGSVRYMTSASTRRKIRLDRYLSRYGSG